MQHIFVKKIDRCLYVDVFYGLLKLCNSKRLPSYTCNIVFWVGRFKARYIHAYCVIIYITVHISNILNDFCWGWCSTESMIIKTRKFCPFWVTTDGEQNWSAFCRFLRLTHTSWSVSDIIFRVKGLLFDFKQRCRKVNPFRWFDLMALLKN